jgi:hypothetical protein
VSDYAFRWAAKNSAGRGGVNPVARFRAENLASQKG